MAGEYGHWLMGKIHMQISLNREPPFAESTCLRTRPAWFTSSQPPRGIESGNYQGPGTRLFSYLLVTSEYTWFISVIITGRQAWAVKRTMLMRVRHVPSKVSHEGAENKAKAKPSQTYYVTMSGWKPERRRWKRGFSERQKIMSTILSSESRGIKASDWKCKQWQRRK